MILFHDIETYCEVPIRDGTHIYAASTEIIVHSWAIDDAPAKSWDATAGGKMPEELADALASDCTIVGQNYGNFDRTVLRYNGIEIVPERIHDTMVQALSHGLPGGLDKLCAIFNVPVDLAKDKRGKALIQLFCKPRPKNSKLRRATRHSHPVEWDIFLNEYAPSDITSMRLLYRLMPRWNYPAPKEHALWCLDQRINDRGFRVDTELARAAIKTVERAKKDKDAATVKLSHDQVDSATQRDRLLKHLLEEWGVDLPDMQAGTLERRLADESLPLPVRELIAIRLQVSQTSNAKYNALLKAVSADGRLRGTLQFSGAARTKRWAGRTFQPQNLPRPDAWFDAAEQELAATVMKSGAAHMFYDEPIAVASNAIRGCIVAAEGRKLVVSDLEQIEARTLPWLAGEHWKVAAFRKYDAGEGYDLYTLTAAKLLGKHPSEVTKAERQAYGKVVELAAGYGGALGAFNVFAQIYGVSLPEEQIYEIIRNWRLEHPALCDWDTGFWTALDTAARLAIASPGKVFDAGAHIRFERWRNWLKMHLPSGGFLSYAAPQIVADPKRPGRDAISYMGLNNYTRRWERLYTYGGKLSADATQSTAREVLAHNLPAIEVAGYPPIMLVHDEVITEPLDDPAYSVDKLNTLLATNPPWALDLPLAAGGFESARYRKE